MKIKYDREGYILDILVRDGQIHYAEGCARRVIQS